ncbi:MAG: antibiotic biosynthesis monooxygenase [Cenarchaeum sp. SB0661_bin_35]|nr:antibiotic biosynthesis monooxygenase [Cenarchaeum sp. SB0662_bin_33]MYC79611.1 antibiotic biosynthesis monooxygenase [Cenarchaeum sp. SB0661_bin_35]MYD59077.1 antibiotic biosynthesis monooxygenase [Cenarchaeum sp. SB0678_bin_8]
MVVIMMDVKIKPGMLDDFKDWVTESNKVVSKFDGFVSRRLLESVDKNHRIIVEFQTPEHFIKMRQSPEHQAVHIQGEQFREVGAPTMYKVIAE